jgi:simple sugar transport system ATP-binding protein
MVTSASQTTGGFTAQGDPPPAIELRGIDKRFGDVHANRNVDLTVAVGTIHGIVGENGAGKSTLMSILYGFYEADAGEIRIHGKPLRIRSANDALQAGIGMVHQHFMLVDTFSVLENVMLGAESGAVLNRSKMLARQELERLEQDYGLQVDPDAVVEELPVGEQQRAEILKSLYRGAEILILDEPTGVLTPQESDQLFEILRSLKERGVTILLITHKLREIMDLTDFVSVMRQGEIVAHRRTSETNQKELAELMVGRSIEQQDVNRSHTPGEAVLTVENVSMRDAKSVTRVDDVSFEVRAGEIVGIAGVAGNGQTELLELLSGIRPLDSGSFHVNGRQVTPQNPCSPKDMRRLRVNHVPEDRHRLGLVMPFLAEESSILGYHDRDRINKGLALDYPLIIEDCAEMMRVFDVRPVDPTLRSSNFSGGNQQKIVLAREMDKEPTLLLVGQPTRGVDVGAIEFIHGQLLSMRDRGCAILLVSVELDEILALSDRILVMFEGRIVGDVAGAEADKKQLGLLMANASPDAAESAAVS